MGGLEKKIDRRTLVKGAAAVGGMVWALPIVETVAMPSAFAAGSGRPPVPGLQGARFVFVAGIAAAPLWSCGPLTSPLCVTPPDPSQPDACAHAFVISSATDGTSLTIGIAPGWTMKSPGQGAAHTSTNQCIPAVQGLSPGVVSEEWTFTGDGNPFTAEVLIDPLVV